MLRGRLLTAQLLSKPLCNLLEFVLSPLKLGFAVLRRNRTVHPSHCLAGEGEPKRQETIADLQGLLELCRRSTLFQSSAECSHVFDRVLNHSLEASLRSIKSARCVCHSLITAVRGRHLISLARVGRQCARVS